MFQQQKTNHLGSVPWQDHFVLYLLKWIGNFERETMGFQQLK